LLRGIQWCRKYGIRVMIDFHAAPGSQNGWNHSGRSGEIRFLNKTNPYSKQNVQRFRKIVANVVKFFSKKEFSNVVTMIGVLNEPAVMLTDKETTLAFYKDSYKDIQTSINNKTNNLLLAYHDGFVGLKSWEDTMPKSLFPNAVMDSHSYIIFDAGLIVKPLDEINNFPCTAWANDFKQSANTFGPTICGEFSVASNDCGKWLNGINLGTRYEGTFPSSTPVCDNCTCKGTQDYKNFSKNYKQFLLKFAEKQMDAFEQGSGWFFWNFKTEDHINPHWDYFVGLKEGWIPKDANNRTYGCDLISSVSSN
ncbi:glycoside hydrolase, partial [Neoconidiobolus thromboides FSU 785]